MNVLLTGASGFVGRAILQSALSRNINIRPVFRESNFLTDYPEAVLIKNLNGEVDWTHALKGVEIVIHAAARINTFHKDELFSISKYREINVDGTMNLAQQAAKSGVRRFVFISSIKVNGEETNFGAAFRADHKPCPFDAYGLSKAEAEAGLIKLADQTDMEVTIIRPPLVYGAGVRGNFSMLLKCVKYGIPLPLGGILKNRRSFVSIDNLVDFIFLCFEHPRAANQIFLVSDGHDLSTVELLVKIGKALNRPPILISVSPQFLNHITKLCFGKSMAQRLFGSLQVDIRKACELLDWEPPLTVDEAMLRTVGE